jgi:hypothetical protein
MPPRSRRELLPEFALSLAIESQQSFGKLARVGE